MSADLNARLTLDNRQFIQGLRQANAGQGNFNAQMGGAAGGAARAAGAVKALASSYLALKAAQAGFRMGKQALFKAGALESETARLEVLLGSVKEAESLMARVMGTAGRTPLETTELQQATRTLIALGSEADSVLDELEMMGDISQGVGMEINELANIYGKMRSKGMIQAEELNQLAERGIPIIAEFANQLGVSEGEVRKLASEGKITFENLQQGFQNLTGEGGKFNNMMERMSTTMEGKLSTLRDNFDQMIMIPMGKWVAGWVEPMVEGLNKAAASMRELNELTQAGGKDDLYERFKSFSNEEERGTLQDDLREEIQRTEEAIAGIRENRQGTMYEDYEGERIQELQKHLQDYKVLLEETGAVGEAEMRRRQRAIEAASRAERERQREELEAKRAAAMARVFDDALERGNSLNLQEAIDAGDLETVKAELDRIEEGERELFERLMEAEEPEAIQGLPRRIAEARDEAQALREVLEGMQAEVPDPPDEPDEITPDVPPPPKPSVRAPEVDSLMRLGLSLGGDLQMPNLEKEQLSETKRQTQMLAEIKKNTVPDRRRSRDNTSRWG